MGLSEVARIEAEMARHLRTLGFVEGSVKARMASLDASLQPPTDAYPRPQLFDRYPAIERDAELRSAALFDLRPHARLPVAAVVRVSFAKSKIVEKLYLQKLKNSKSLNLLTLFSGMFIAYVFRSNIQY
jgi:uncharacterized protein (DUF885 family)